MLFPHQTRVVNHLLSHRGLIAAHQTGSGKTIAAIASIEALQKTIPDLQTIVITQLSIKKQFEQEVNKWNLSNVSYFSPKAFTLAMADPDLEKRPNLSNCFLILDEAHNMRTHVHINQKDQVTNGQQAYFIMKAASLAKKVLCLTATPIINDLFDVYNLVAMVDGISPDQCINRDTFIKAIEDDNDFQDFFSCKFSFHKGNGEGRAQRIDMPTEYFTMTETYYQNYMKVERKQTTEEIRAMVQANTLNDMFWNILRRAVNCQLDSTQQNPKIEWCRNHIIQAMQNKQKTLIYSNWKDAGISIIQSMCKELGISFVSVVGDMSDEERYQAMQTYNDDSQECYVMLITKAGSEGLDLKGTRSVVLLESNWHAACEEQIIGRAIRQGSHAHLSEEDRDVKVYRLMMLKPSAYRETDTLSTTVDEAMYNLAYHRKQPIMEQFYVKLQECSIEHQGCKCHSKKIIRLKASKFLAKAKKTKEVCLPDPNGGFKFMNANSNTILASTPATMISNKDGIPQIQSRFKGHTSYTALLMCKNKKCPCKSC
jgi:superfamily II DNA or RNA helicase